MAPIDPQQILKAFEPVCSSDGGIVNSKEIPRLSGLMKKYSKKLVSKCTYCNILLATDEKVLEEFLNNDGWETINSWLKDAIEKKNDVFLIELIKLLKKCPITVDRLKSNNTPKLLKNIVKADNEELAKNAKNLRTKWKNFVDRNIGPEFKDKEKRKLKDSSNSNRENNQSNNTNKKLKTDKDENVNLNNAQDLTNKIKTDSNEQNDSGTKAIKSTKCKLGKTRSIGVLEKTDYSKPLSTSGSSSGNQITDQKPSTNNSNVGSSFITKNASMLLNHTASTPSLPLNKLNKHDKNGIHIQIIDPQPLPITELTNSTISHSGKHVIKESAGFINALSSMPTGKIKKKKKISTVTTDKTTNCKEEKMEIDNSLSDLNDQNCSTISNDDAKLNLSDGNNNSNEFSANSSINLTQKTTESEFLIFSKESPYDPNKQPEKGILQYVAKGRKRNICWPDDDKLEKVKYFELDDKERCNVYKQIQNFSEHRKEEVEKERNQMNNLRGQMKYLTNNPGICFFTWRLIKIDGLVEGDHFYPTGKESEEKNKQAERLKDVLEFIDLPGKPEFPKEPDAISNDQLEEYQTKEILLGDENGTLFDYSNHQFNVSEDVIGNSYSTGQVINSAASDNLFYQQQITTANNLINSPQFYNNLNNVNQLFNNQNMYSQQIYPNVYLNGQVAQSQMPPVSVEQNRWSTSNWDYQQNLNSNKNNKNTNKKSKKPLCKFWSKGNSCRHGDKCLFLHSK